MENLIEKSVRKIIQRSRDSLDAHSRLFLNFEWEKAQELRMV
jgi:hypothetical protein